LPFRIITEREERAPIAIATNLPFSEWVSVPRAALLKNPSAEHYETGPDWVRDIDTEPQVAQRGAEGWVLASGPIHVGQDTKTVPGVREHVFQWPSTHPTEKVRITGRSLGQDDQGIHDRAFTAFRINSAPGCAGRSLRPGLSDWC
jgi:hypothetical protein